MRKSDKKREKQLVSALKVACESALLRYDGFLWLTHRVDYDRYPESLLIVCVFDTHDQLAQFQAKGLAAQFEALIQAQLRSVGVALAQPERHIQWDSEQACLAEHAGRWKQRLASH